MKQKNPTMSERGRLGGIARHNKSFEELADIRKKALKTLLEKEPDFYKKIGKKGTEARLKKGFDYLSNVSKKGAITRAKDNPDIFKELGSKGGKIANLNKEK